MGLGSLHLLKPVSKYVGAGGVGMAGPPFLGQATVSQWPFQKNPLSLKTSIFPSAPFGYLHLCFSFTSTGELCEEELALVLGISFPIPERGSHSACFPHLALGISLLCS